MTKKGNPESDLYNSPLFQDVSTLNVVFARFESYQKSSFKALIDGYSSMKVLTYSNSVSIINETAKVMDELEIIFGREDIVGTMAQYMHYQELLIKELKAKVKGKDFIEEKIDNGKIRLYVIKDAISHEKFFLMEGEQGNRVLTGSANFSEKAFSGNQNEGYICFDNDEAAWEFYNEKYEKIKASSTMNIAKNAVLDEHFDIEDIPIFDPAQTNTTPPQVIVIREMPPAATVIQKMLSSKTPKQYTGLSQIIPPEKGGVVRIDKQRRSQAVLYVKSNSRTEEENPDQYFSIHVDSRKIILSGKELDLEVSEQAIKSDVALMTEYFQGFTQFRGDAKKLARDYFTFMSWFYISPFICDFRNRALANVDDNLNHLDYPIFGMLYGKSNCGKSELIKTLLVSMFQQEGFLPNDWFTKSQVAGLREQNKRYPMVFDDLTKDRFTAHAIALIKDDYFSLKEYPSVVLSMNADKDTFEPEIRKRCLIIYTGASLPDHTGESRKLASKLRQIKKNLTSSLYQEYLIRVLETLRQEFPTDILAFSSQILHEIFTEYSPDAVPAWCRITNMEEYTQSKYDKIKDELLQIWQYNASAWSEKGNKIILKLDDVHSLRKLKQDIPDYTTFSRSGDAIIFFKDELESFLDTPLSTKKRWFPFFYR